LYLMLGWPSSLRCVFDLYLMLGCFTGTWSSSLRGVFDFYLMTGLPSSPRGVFDLYLTLGSFLGIWLIALRGVFDLYLSKDVAHVLGPALYEGPGGYKKGALDSLVVKLLAHGRWFSPASKTGRHDIAEILLKVALSTKISNQIKCT
jgi:hypothetical protein